MIKNTNKGALSVKAIVVIVAVVLLGALGFGYLGRDGGNANTDQIIKSDTTASQVGADVLSALNQLKVLNLDGSIFTDPAYKSLRDFSRPIQSQPVGRENPFLPINAKSTSTSTKQANDVGVGI